jgi:UMF1 family MFS transporter
MDVSTTTASPEETLASPGLALDEAAPTSWKKVLSWAFWDWGTQPYNTIVITFVFAVYLVGEEFGSKNYTSQALGLTTSVAGVFVALLAPVLGQNADRNNSTMRDLRWYTWSLAGLTALLYFIKPSPGYLIPGLVLLAIGTVISEIAQVSNNAVLDEVASGHNVGRISGFGWGMGYMGGIVSLLLFNFGVIAAGNFMGISSYDSVTSGGIDPTTGEEILIQEGFNGLGVRLTMLGSAVWILLFTLPMFLNIQDRHIAGGDKKKGLGVVGSYVELVHSIGRLWKISRQTVVFLVASAFFRDGLNAIFSFGAVIAALTFDFSPGEVIIFGAAANVVAGISTMLFGLLDDRVGPRKVILASLICLIVLATTIFVLHDGGKIVFWTAGIGLTLFVGPAQSASRSYLARIIPTGHSGEVFGLYATTGRAVSFLAPACYTIAIGIGASATGSDNATHWGILGIVFVLVLGFAAMLVVKDPDSGAMIAANESKLED